MSKISQRNKELKQRQTESKGSPLSSEEVKRFKVFLFEKGVNNAKDRERIARILLKAKCSLKEAIDAIERHGLNGMFSYLEKSHPDALKAIRLFSAEFDYSDNFRMSFGEGISEFFYQVALSNGCCGFYDGEMSYRGKTVKFGFNYGH
jgi:hypothetical protein